MDRLQKKLDLNRDWLHFTEQMDLDAETVIVSYGSSARTSLEAKYEFEKKNGKKIGFLRLITLWPFHYTKMADMLQHAKRVVVVEMNQGQMIREIARAVRRGVDVIGVNRVDGELITPEEVLAVL
jgi:2-oxoglutarate ferredoxin oxidoreductase subunit alpha